MSQGLNKISTFVLGCFAEPSAARGSQEQAAEANRSLEQPGAARSSNKIQTFMSGCFAEPEAARGSQEEQSAPALGA